MATIQRLPLEQAYAMLNTEEVIVVDVRDEQSFAAARIAGARHLSNNNIGEFVSNQEPDATVLVYCYHGNSSQGAAAYLQEQGFKQVFSMDGGFEGWRQRYPIEQ